ncbi:MAG: murein biosynthesis integral membrane protein MurJ [Endomicrobia bacterium]|nr:murein biosynthesis integral membrane protein MurJ [Endomicrobiia bacterium]MCL2506643.1 murein biosynthesis integral membrane protein MurJ [Endomicrobiia bacterium]
MEQKTLTKNAGKAASGTFFSRILGYVRDMLVANLFGAGMFADAFYAAFRIPNLFRRLFGEGAFSAAFIPVFSEYLHTKDKSETQKFLTAVFTALFVILTVVTILGMFFAPVLVKIIAWGFTNDPEKMQMTVELTRLMFPFIMFICLAAFLLAILNTLQSFFLPALAPSALSVSEIFYMLAIAPMLGGGNQIKGLAISVIAGGALHFVIQYPKLKALGWYLKLKLTIDGEPFYKHPGIKRIWILMIPAMIGLSVDQINSFVDTICASFLESGSITALYYSNRLMQMPLAIFGLAFATVSLPALSKACAIKDMTVYKDSLSHSIRFSVFMLLPAMAGLMVIGLPIIRLLFEHGKFDSVASLMTNDALFYYSLGLPAYALSKIYANAFFALQDTKTPVKSAALAMILHVILCVILMYPMGVGGLALATAVASYFNLFLLVIWLKKRMGKIGMRNILISSAKSFVAAIFTAVTAFYSIQISQNLFIAVPFAVFAGSAAFFLTALFLKSEEVKVFAKILKK